MCIYYCKLRDNINEGWKSGKINPHFLHSILIWFVPGNVPLDFLRWQRDSWNFVNIISCTGVYIMDMNDHGLISIHDEGGHTWPLLRPRAISGVPRVVTCLKSHGNAKRANGFIVAIWPIFSLGSFWQNACERRIG